MANSGSNTILITGATDGIGRGTAEALARGGAKLLLHGRDPGRLEETRDEIAAVTGAPPAEIYCADFASLEEVRRLAAELGERHERLDVLINNAGIGRGSRDGTNRELSRDGYELRLQVNHLAPFLLTELLLPLLRNGAPSRIVNVASAAQDEIDFDDVMLEHGYTGSRAYGQSKLAMVMGSLALADRLASDEITVNALHPGTLLDTKMVREAWGQAQGPVSIGIESETYLAVDPALDGVTGEYFDRTRTARAHPQAYDEQARERLFSFSMELCGLPV